MAYSGDPGSSNIDLLRFTLGDTDTASELLSDSEYDYLIDSNNATIDPLVVAPLAAEMIAAKMSSRVDYRIHGVTVSASDLAEHYRKLAERLASKVIGALSAGVPFAGGISVDDKVTREDNEDNIDPAFTVGMHDLPA